MAGSLIDVANANTTPPTLYVAETTPYQCNDSGPGTQAMPFCHIQAAANVVVPGQTVIVGYRESNAFFTEDVRITRSGAPGQPIVFKAGSPWNGSIPAVNVGGPTWTTKHLHGFTITGVHDVTIDGFGVDDTVSAGIAVVNSHNITINHIATRSNSPAVDGVDITGASSAVTVSRSLLGATGSGVYVGLRDSGVIVADNIFGGGGSVHAVSVRGNNRTAITNNTAAYTYCPKNVFSVTAAATGATIENNLVFASCSTPTPLVTVAADSTTGATEDYNIVYAPSDLTLYSWAGTTYRSAAALHAATGRGAHDLNTRQNIGSGWVPMEHTPAVDSADANARGVLPADFNGNSHEDDPVVANTGTGYGFLDRGAVERRDPMSVNLSVSASPVTTSQTMVATVTATQGWAPITGYTVDFGDGTPPVASTSNTIDHVYPTAGYYTMTATATDGLGNTSDPSAPRYIQVTAG